MDKQRLEELTKRAASATALANDISELHNVNDPYDVQHNLSVHMRQRLIELGKAALLAEKESELELLLGVQLVASGGMAAASVISVSPPEPLFPFLSSQSNDQPAQPFAEIVSSNPA